MRDIRLVLERWGGWAASEGCSVYYPPVSAGFKNLLPATQAGRLKCSDNDGLIISSAMNCLKKKDPYLCTLLEWHYVQAMPVRAMGERLGVSHTHVLKRLQAAEGFIDGCLAMLDVVLEMDQSVQSKPQAIRTLRRSCSAA
ncbi:antitermination protein [Escherichia coli]|nr:antitermination protein [Escherichia coli]MBB7318661.1 antitermination protein [Escherichia coli]